MADLRENEFWSPAEQASSARISSTCCATRAAARSSRSTTWSEDDRKISDVR